MRAVPADPVNPINPVRRLRRSSHPMCSDVYQARSALSADPTDLELASAYWNAVGSGQSGRYVIEAFRAAALQSPEGAVALANAYRNLAHRTGEGPRRPFDPQLTYAMRHALAVLSEDDREVVAWCLDAASRTDDVDR